MGDISRHRPALYVTHGEPPNVLPLIMLPLINLSVVFCGVAHAAARVYHAYWRHGGNMAARGAGAAGIHAGEANCSLAPDR
jgi:hypothetical protein